jgi:hypothetical protein
MTISIRAHYDGKAIIPDEPVDLPVDKPLTIQVQAAAEGVPTGTAAELANSGLFGIWKNRKDIGDSLEFARKLRKQGGTRHHEINDPG